MSIFITDIKSILTLDKTQLT